MLSRNTLSRVYVNLRLRQSGYLWPTMWMNTLAAGLINIYGGNKTQWTYQLTIFWEHIGKCGNTCTANTAESTLDLVPNQTQWWSMSLTIGFRIQTCLTSLWRQRIFPIFTMSACCLRKMRLRMVSISRPLSSNSPKWYAGYVLRPVSHHHLRSMRTERRSR